MLLSATVLIMCVLPSSASVGHVGGLELTIMEVLTPWELGNPSHQGFYIPEGKGQTVTSTACMPACSKVLPTQR